MPGVHPEVVPTTGSIENLRLLAAREADVAFVAADAAEALAGRAPFPAPVAVAAIARAYDDYLHLVVPLESDVDGRAGWTWTRSSPRPSASGTWRRRSTRCTRVRCSARSSWCHLAVRSRQLPFVKVAGHALGG
jgi:NMT1-like family